MSEIVAHEQDGELLTALVVVFDTPGRSRRIAKALDGFPALYPSGPAEFLAAVSTPVNLLMISTHGIYGSDEISGGGGNVEIAEIQAHTSTLIVTACYQDERRAKLWKGRTGSAGVVHASGEPEWETSARAIRRVLERPSSWIDAPSAATVFLDAPRAAPVFQRAGWSIDGNELPTRL